ncbi:response regulator transcription factor [Streptomyces sp. 6N223]|uniref:response regulator transcription factor n=1 Tax=Streptomyces sp. 6N223 TaxID=3457412 RepID=UPI003FCFB62E
MDGHRIFAESLATALTAEQDVEALAVGSVPAALHLLERIRGGNEQPFDVLLIDAELDGALQPAGASPGGASPNGAAQAASLLTTALQRYPATRTVMLATFDDPANAAQALAAGACGWIAKDASLARLLAVLRGVLRDETHLSPALLTGVLRELTRDRRHRDEHQRLVESLTPRELEVLRCMLAGLGRKAVAERLYLSPHTVRTHMQNVLSKLGVHSTLAAVALARRAGVPPAD